MLTPDFLWLEFGNPTILNLDNETYEQNPNFHIVKGSSKFSRSIRFLRHFGLIKVLPDDFESGYVFMVIEASTETTIPLPANTSVIQCE